MSILLERTNETNYRDSTMIGPCPPLQHTRRGYMTAFAVLAPTTRPGWIGHSSRAY